MKKYIEGEKDKFKSIINTSPKQKMLIKVNTLNL